MSEQSLEMHFKMQLNLHGFSEVDAVLAFLKMGTAKALCMYLYNVFRYKCSLFIVLKFLKNSYKTCEIVVSIKY